jgi:phosphatidate cytidylyltransferase
MSAADGGERRSSDLVGRIMVAVPAAVLAIVFVDIGGLAWAVLMASAACACMYELYRMLDRWKPVSAVGLVIGAAMCLVAHFGAKHGVTGVSNAQRDVLGVAVAALPLVFLGVLLRGQSAGATAAIASTLLGVFWLGFAFAHATLLRELPHGTGVLIDVMLGTFLGDTGAYLGGRMFGRHPLAPTVSPNKTIEGLGIGAIVAIVAVVVAGLYQPWLPHGTALLLGISIALLGPLGDLFESLVKRDAGTKDAGTMFGAHGGALDRLDAVSFTVVVGYYIWTAVQAH